MCSALFIFLSFLSTERITSTNLTCFQKSAYYSGIKVFSNLPSSLKSLMNEKAQFKLALKRIPTV
jgi:hypothetical protein